MSAPQRCFHCVSGVCPGRFHQVGVDIGGDADRRVPQCLGNGLEWDSLGEQIDAAEWRISWAVQGSPSTSVVSFLISRLTRSGSIGVPTDEVKTRLSFFHLPTELVLLLALLDPVELQPVNHRGREM